MSVRGSQKCFLVVALLLLLCSSVAKAQDYDFSGRFNEDKGPTASELISGSSTSISGTVKFDTAIGWNFTKNFGVDVGVPYMFDTRPGIFASTDRRIGYVNYPVLSCTYFFGCFTGVGTSSRIWAGELGDVYPDVHYTRPYKKYNFATTLTGDAPTASYRKGLTSGRVQWDWFNHVDTDLHGFSPFVNFGIANGRMDQHFLPRPFNTNLPFRTLGYIADFEGGVQYKLWRRISLGGSVWDVLPMGPQEIYSNLVWQAPGQENILAVGAAGGNGTLAPIGSTTQTNVPGTYGFPGGYIVGGLNNLHQRCSPG